MAPILKINFSFFIFFFPHFYAIFYINKANKKLMGDGEKINIYKIKSSKDVIHLILNLRVLTRITTDKLKKWNGIE